MSAQLEETKWAYIAGLIDGEGYLDIFLHTNPSRRKIVKKGYGREFRCNICNSNKELLNKVQEMIGEKCELVEHKRKPYLQKTQNSGFTLRFHPTVLRILLPKIIPFLILKKELAQIILEELTIIKKVKGKKRPPKLLREKLLLKLDHKFRELCLAGNVGKRRLNRVDNKILAVEGIRELWEQKA
jgi:hypothetical protein